MESLVIYKYSATINMGVSCKQLFRGVFRDTPVLVTGHTGFKGAWLSEWLLQLGARVSGLALQPSEQDGLFERLRLSDRIEHYVGDIRNRARVSEVVRRSKPRFVFHLAAQPLVRYSYTAPLETYETNVLGTAYVLDALREAAKPCTVVAVTTDKCYENREWVHSYREEDPLGGYDPYSSSKAAAELVVSAYRRSFFSDGGCPVRLASARAGNVIGGGDWAADRIVPDTIRALRIGSPVPVRNKTATRPWQHVLEPLSGYLWLAACIERYRDDLRQPFCGAYNFGPDLTSNRTVLDLVHEILSHWPGEWHDRSGGAAPHEAGRLNLAIDKAYHDLGWCPNWSFERGVEKTIAWYRKAEKAEIPAITEADIAAYVADATEKEIVWTQ